MCTHEGSIGECLIFVLEDGLLQLLQTIVDGSRCNNASIAKLPVSIVRTYACGLVNREV